MFRLVKSLAQPQSARFRILFKASALTVLYQFTSNVLHHHHSTKTSSDHLSSSVSAFNSFKSPESRHIQDLSLIEGLTDEGLASFREILQKYITSRNFSNFTQEESAVLLKAFFKLGKACLETPERGGDGLKYFEEGLAFANTVGIKDSKEVGFLYLGLARGLRLQNRFDEYLVYFHKSLDIFKKFRLDPDVYALSQLVPVERELFQGNIEKAEAFLQVAEKDAESFEDSVEKKIINIINVRKIFLYTELAEKYYAKENFEKVSEYARKALDRIDEIPGPNDSSKITPLHLLARTLNRQGKFDDALHYAQKLNQILSHNYGAQEKRIAIQNLVNIGQIYTRKDDFANAVEFSQKALKLCSDSEEDKALQEDIHHLLGSQLSLDNRRAEALKHQKEAVRLCLESGDKSGNLNEHYFFLALGYHDNKDLKRAEEAAKKSLELRVLKFGKEHSETQMSLSLLLEIRMMQSKSVNPSE